MSVYGLINQTRWLLPFIRPLIRPDIARRGPFTLVDGLEVEWIIHLSDEAGSFTRIDHSARRANFLAGHAKRVGSFPSRKRDERLQHAVCLRSHQLKGLLHIAESESMRRQWERIDTPGF
jgi:hypothetical protein